MTPLSKATVAPAPATPAQIYLRAADATQLTQLEINGKPQNTEEQDGMKRLSLVPGDYQLQVTLKQGGQLAAFATN